jgi:hypothetical protein
MLNFLRDVMIVVAALALLIAIAFHPGQDSEVGQAGRTLDARTHRPPVAASEAPVSGHVVAPAVVRSGP